MNTNTKVTILWDSGDYYVVSINDQIGYMVTEKVSENRYATIGGEDWTPLHCR